MKNYYKISKDGMMSKIDHLSVLKAVLDEAQIGYHLDDPEWPLPKDAPEGTRQIVLVEGDQNVGGYSGFSTSNPCTVFTFNPNGLLWNVEIYG